MIRRVDIAVVGAGPAGISATLAAARVGASVTLIDEWDGPGGHLQWSLAELPPDAGALSGRRGIEISAWGTTKLRETGVTLVEHGCVWGLFEDRVLGVVTPGEAYELQAERVILATGSTDLAMPFPGWELPGVMLTRAAQRLLNIYRVAPGEAVVVIGDGPEAEQVAEELRLAGVSVVARVATVIGVSAGGDGHIEWVELPGQRVSADSIVLALGRQPVSELAQQALCDVGFSELNRAWVPLRTETLETTVPGVYVAGDAAGICTVAEAVAEGRLAGLSATGAGTSEAVAALAALRTSARATEIELLHAPMIAHERAAEELPHGVTP